MPKFRKKPVVIQAIQLTERTEISTLEGVMVGNPGDWLITGVKGEKYPCKDDIFQATYEPVDDESVEHALAGGGDVCTCDIHSTRQSNRHQGFCALYIPSRRR